MPSKPSLHPSRAPSTGGWGESVPLWAQDWQSFWRFQSNALFFVTHPVLIESSHLSLCGFLSSCIPLPWLATPAANYSLAPGYPCGHFHMLLWLLPCMFTVSLSFTSVFFCDIWMIFYPALLIFANSLLVLFAFSGLPTCVWPFAPAVKVLHFCAHPCLCSRPCSLHFSHFHSLHTCGQSWH